MALEIYSAGRVYGYIEFSHQAKITFYIPDTDQLEFRLFCRNVTFTFEGIELAPLLLTREDADATRLTDLIAQLTEEWAAPEPIFRLIERLSETGGAADGERAVARFLARNTDTLARTRAAYMALHHRQRHAVTASPAPAKTGALIKFFRAPNEEPAPADPMRSELPIDIAIPTDLDQIRTMMRAVPITRVHLQAYGGREHRAAHHAVLGAHGYQYAFLEATRHARSHDVQRRLWQRDPGPQDKADLVSRPATNQALANVDLSFQDDLACGRGMLAYCPISGSELRSEHGFAIYYNNAIHIVYAFFGAEPFYVCTGQYINSRMFIFMPVTNILIIIEEEALSWYNYEDFVREFMSQLTFNYEDVLRYLDSKPKRACFFGISNIGHFFWNEMSGLHHALEQNLLKDIDEIVCAPIDFMDYKILFPELTGKKATAVSGDDLFNFGVRNQLTPVRFSDGVITPSFLARVQRTAKAHASPAGRPPDAVPRPLIWLNVRAHNKIWLDQAAGYANILNALREERGQAAALVQGMPDCREIFDEMRRLTHPDIPLFDGLDLNTNDKINWASQVDAYVCVAGAGLAFTTWLADVPGVAHSEHAHLDHLHWWPWVRPGSRPALAPQRSEVIEIGSGTYCNYKVEWKVLFKLLLEALAMRDAQP